MLTYLYRVRRILSLLWNVREVFWCLDIASRIIGSQMHRAKPCRQCKFSVEGYWEIKNQDREDLYKYLAYAGRTRGADHEDGRFLPRRVPSGWDWSRSKWYEKQ